MLVLPSWELRCTGGAAVVRGGIRLIFVSDVVSDPKMQQSKAPLIICTKDMSLPDVHEVSF